MKVIQGDRVGRLGALTVGCSAAIFDETGERILLTRRTDNGRWCLPGGRMDAGESAEEACRREVREETSLEVRVVRLIGIYSSPNILLEYADGNRYQVMSLSFGARPVGGRLTLSDETTDHGYFTQDEITTLDVVELHLPRIADAFARQEAAFVR